jgi:ABC-type lipoprotein release transport system permease subunit
MFHLAVAFRFLKEGRTQTVLILVGITLGIAVQVFLNALIIDLQRSLVEDTVGKAPYITASTPDVVPGPGLKAAAGGEPVLARVVTNEGNVKPIRDWTPVVAQLEKIGDFRSINPVARGSGFILQGQGSSSYIIQLFVLLSVTLAIASVLAISVVQRSRQIGILKALGMRTRQVGRIFVIQGAVLGFAGSLLGSLAGWGLIEVFVSLQRANRAGSLTDIPVGWGSIAVSVFVATAAGTVAAFVPARRAARLNPIEVIRNG